MSKGLDAVYITNCFSPFFGIKCNSFQIPKELTIVGTLCFGLGYQFSEFHVYRMIQCAHMVLNTCDVIKNCYKSR